MLEYSEGIYKQFETVFETFRTFLENFHKSAKNNPVSWRVRILKVHIYAHMANWSAVLRISKVMAASSSYKALIGTHQTVYEHRTSVGRVQRTLFMSNWKAVLRILKVYICTYVYIYTLLTFTFFLFVPPGRHLHQLRDGQVRSCLNPSGALGLLLFDLLVLAECFTVEKTATFLDILKTAFQFAMLARREAALRVNKVQQA